MGKKKKDQDKITTKDVLDVFNRPTKREAIPVTFFAYLRTTILSESCSKKSKFLIPAFNLLQNPDGSFYTEIKEKIYLKYKDIKYVDIEFKNIPKPALDFMTKKDIFNKIFCKEKPRKISIINKVKHPDEKHTSWLYDATVRIPRKIFSLLVVEDEFHTIPYSRGLSFIYITKLEVLLSSASESRYAISLLDKDKRCVCYVITSKTKIDRDDGKS